MINRLAIAISASSLAALIGGCSALSAQADPTRYFVLTSSPREQTQVDRFTGSIGIGPLKVPDHLQDYLVTRLADQEVVISDTDRWNEPLQESLRNVLRQDLMAQLGTDRVVLYPWGPAAPPDLAIALEVLHFERKTNGTADLTARWSIERGSDRKVLVTQETAIQELIAGTDSRDTAAALSVALGRLSRYIAAEIRRVSPTKATKDETPLRNYEAGSLCRRVDIRSTK
jgi:uncharacterized lipoprotein YmbA